MDKHLTQMLKDHNLKLKYEDIHGPGFLIPTPDNDPDFIVVPQNASNEHVENVILHEIGHSENDDDCVTDHNYQGNYGTRVKMEYGANGFMIRERVAKYVALGNDVLSSNYVDLANSIGTTNFGQVRDELKKYIRME